MAQLEYLTKIMQVIEKIDKEQSENIQAAADLCAAPSTPASWSTCLVADTACSRSRMYSPATAA